MGSGFTLPFQDPVFFSYYGAIRHNDASEALDAVIASHLHDIGAGNTIPIHSEVAEDIFIPVSLNSIPITYIDEKVFIVSFSSTVSGKVSVITNESLEYHFFEPSSINKASFSRKNILEVVIRFDFEENLGVSARIYSINMKNPISPVILDDKIIRNGMRCTISKVFRNQINDDSSQPNDEDLCLICCSERSTVVALPCRHCCMCRTCSEKFAAMSSHCPVCRSMVYELIECVKNKQ